MIGLQAMLLLSALTAPVAAQVGGWPVGRLHEASTSIARLPPADRLLVHALLRPEMGPLFQDQSPRTLDKAISSFRAERLNLGGAPALAVQPIGDELCGATGNCSFWIIDIQHRRILFRSDVIQTFAVDRISPHGLPDIITGTHSSATETDLIRWHYEGAQYIHQSCATVDYADADGNAYKQPKIDSHPCSIEGN
ncbi:MAG TPA: hypothetical protein VIJ65_05675 [Acidobacteriaceae bacterium]